MPAPATASIKRPILRAPSGCIMERSEAAIDVKMERTASQILRGYLAGIAAVAAVTFVGYRLRLNLSATGSLYFLTVVMVAMVWGFWEASVTSLIAFNCLNFFFIPPVFTF